MCQPRGLSEEQTRVGGFMFLSILFCKMIETDYDIFSGGWNRWVPRKVLKIDQKRGFPAETTNLFRNQTQELSRTPWKTNIKPVVPCCPPGFIPWKAGAPEEMWSWAVRRRNAARGWSVPPTPAPTLWPGTTPSILTKMVGWILCGETLNRNRIQHDFWYSRSVFCHAPRMLGMRMATSVPQYLVNPQSSPGKALVYGQLYIYIYIIYIYDYSI